MAGVDLVVVADFKGYAAALALCLHGLLLSWCCVNRFNFAETAFSGCLMGGVGLGFFHVFHKAHIVDANMAEQPAFQ